MTENIISSMQNPKLKRLLALQHKSSERRGSGLFVVEGLRELEHCSKAGFEIDTVFYCPERIESTARQAFKSALSDYLYQQPRMVEVTTQVYEKIAYRGSTEGVVAEVKARTQTLDNLTLPPNPLIVVLERVEKPGNLGAILRSADGAAADAVIVCDPLTDLYNPNLIRSSVGAVFSIPCVACTSEECINFLKARKIRILTAQLQDSSLYYDADMRTGVAIVMGTEATGLTDVWRKAADAHIRIPMLGKVDSLNVSVSTAILLFEAVRQRTVTT